MALYDVHYRKEELMILILVLGCLAVGLGLYLLARHYEASDWLDSMMELINQLDNPFIMGIVLLCVGLVLILVWLNVRLPRQEQTTPPTASHNP